MVQNKLTPIKPTNLRSSNGGIIWEYSCSCGNICFSEGHRVRKNLIRSCGCLRKSKDPEKSGLKCLYQTYKYNADCRGLSFRLNFKSFCALVAADCHYCGVTPRQVSKKNFSVVVNGIDRKTNSNGYNLKNCVTCCSTCNTAKMSKSYTEFISWLDNLILFRTNRAEVRYKNTNAS